MGEPASEELRELERLMVVAAETDAPVSVVALQEELGLGFGQVSEMLRTLAEHGKAIEADAPGMWRGPLAVDEGAPSSVAASGSEGRVPVRAAVDGGEGEDAPFPDGGFEGFVSVPTVRLTYAIVGALDSEALGQLVKAGLEECRERGAVFVLEVSSG